MRDNSRDEQEIARLYGQGESVRSISRITGVHGITVTNILERLGITPVYEENRPRLGHRKELPLSTEEIARRYEAGAAIHELADLCGAAPQTIRRRLTDHGVTIRQRDQQVNLTPPPVPGGKPRVLLPEEQIVQAYQEGLSTVTLAERYGVSASTIRALLLRNGVTLRPRRTPKESTGQDKQKNLVPALTNQQADEVARLYRAGASERSLAAKFSVSRTAVEKALEDQGISRRRSLHSDLPVEELARRYAAGETAAALAREFGVGPTTVKRKLKEYNAGTGSA